MTDRILKALFSLILGAMALTYVAHNIANLPHAYGFFEYTTSHAGQEAYPVTLLPVPPAPLIVAAMVLVFGLELAAGVFGVLGAVRLWKTRRADAWQFDQAKTFAKIACGCAVANWWGLFQVIAVAGYQLWQMPNGNGPYPGSWIAGGMAMLFLIYLAMPERETVG